MRLLKATGQIRSNILADIKGDLKYLAELDDYGEGVDSPIIPKGIRIFICRETTPEYYEISKIS